MKFKLFVFIAICVFGVGVAFAFCVPSARAENNVGGNKEEIDELNKQIEAKKENIKKLEDSIISLKKTIEKTHLEAVSLTNLMNILGNRIAQTTGDIKITEEKIAEAKLEIEALQLSIQDKEAVIAKQKIIISKMVRNIHAEDQKNYLEIMLTSASFADFYNQIKYLESVYTDLGRSVKNLRLAKEDLDAKKIQVESRKKLYEDLKTELDNKQKDLIDQSNTKQTMLDQTRSSERRYQTLLSIQKQQYQAIEGEVRSYEDQVRKKLEEMDKFQNLDSGSGELSWPVPSRYITASFHDPDYPYRRVFEHSGIDLRASQGTAIKAAAAGYVARAKRCSLASCYSYVLIVHTGNISTLYGHMSSISVSEDQFVARGDVIGYTGGTPGTVGAGPFVTGPHLHFEVRANGIPVNPMGYLQ
jgi:murein DD-endopeptidase MepM/ murein hydrolase activator NlpD